MTPRRAALLLLALCAATQAAQPRFLGKPPKEKPRRIVTLAPSITEIVLDLGAGDRIVGVTRYDDAPEVKRVRRVGGFLDPAPETVLALKPDLVVAQPSPGNRGPVDRLAKLGVPVLVTPLHTVPEILASMRAVGKALHEPAAADRAVARIEQGLAEVRARTEGLPRPKVLVVYGWQPLVVAGPGSLAAAIVGAAGGENAAAGTSGPYPVLPAEAALASGATVIVDASGVQHGGGSIPGLDARVVVLRSPAIMRPGPRLVEAVHELAAVLHPDAFAPSAAAPP